MTSSPRLSEGAAANLQRLRDDFDFFSRNCLLIRLKSGQVVPFVMNRAQRRLHEALERQRAETGRVRAIIVKGRQLGASTYIQARFYWRLWSGQGLRAFILTHEVSASNNMFSMARRYHENFPGWIRRPTTAANAKELKFADNDCSYVVATAGNKAVGRSDTLQLYHGSETAYWPNAEDHIGGSFQTVPEEDGTERLLESTANGIGNVFQKRYAAAQRHQSDEEAIFLAWFWGDDYRRDAPDDWTPPPRWWDYGKLHGLEIEQLYWAFRKNADMAAALSLPDTEPCWKFKQEYPATAQEAFETSGNSFIPANKVSIARKASVDGIGPLIIGVDPARGGGDCTGVIDRRGRRMGGLIAERWDDGNGPGALMITVGRIVNLIRRYNPAAVNIDVGGLGAGIYDRLVELEYGYCVNPVNFGASPLQIGPTGDELYANRRAEMWDLMRDWYDSPAGVQIPDDDALHTDMTSAEWGAGKTRHNSNNELILEPKDSIRERLGISPDLGDAGALTFAVPIAPGRWESQQRPHDAGRSSTTGY